MNRFDEVASFTGFDDADRAALQELLPVVKPHIGEIVDRFYSRIESDPEARQVLRDDAQTARLKLTLAGWLERLLGGPWDEEYHRLRSRIGAAHIEVALPQRFMLTAMSVIRVELHRHVELSYTSEPRARAAAHRALARICDIDLAIMLDSYRADSLAAVRRLEEIERRLLSRELEVTEERSLAILDASEILAVTLSTDGQITLFNRQAELASGYSRTEILAEPDLMGIWHPNDRDEMARAIDIARTGAASRIEELRIAGRDGKSRWIRWHIATLPSMGDPDICLVGVDLTAERELAERTRRAETLATLGTLAAGLAHEIRNPLNAAQLQLTLAERRIGHPERRDEALESIAVVRDELGRLASLVGDFLAFARPAPLRVHPCNLVETVQHVVGLLASDAEAAGVAVELEAPAAVALDCDEQRMQQVLINLLQNAIEAAGSGGLVHIRAERRGPSAVVEIADTGEGVPGDIEIFEPFATSKDTGTGLGLPIVRRIVSDHGGRITWARRDDRTVFSLEVPIAGP